MSSLIPHDYRYKISSPTPVDKEPIKFLHPHQLTKSQKTIEDKIFYGLKNYTNSITTISAASPRRGPTFKIRVYPPLRSA